MDIYDGTEAEDIGPDLQSILDHWTIFLQSLPEGVKPPSPIWSMEFGRRYPLDDIHPLPQLSKAKLCDILADEEIKSDVGWTKNQILDLFPPYVKNWGSLTGRGNSLSGIGSSGKNMVNPCLGVGYKRPGDSARLTRNLSGMSDRTPIGTL